MKGHGTKVREDEAEPVPRSVRSKPSLESRSLCSGLQKADILQIDCKARRWETQELCGLFTSFVSLCIFHLTSSTPLYPSLGIALIYSTTVNHA